MDRTEESDEICAAMVDEADTEEVIDCPVGTGDVDEVLTDMDEIGLDGEEVGFSGEEGATSGETTDDADIVFLEHTDAVFCVQIDPLTSGKAVTGGQDDRALVWDISSGKTFFECTGHTDSVTSVGFSFDGRYLATADMSGIIQVWCVDTGEHVWLFECTDIEWLEWHPKAHVLLAGTAEGDGWVWKIPSGKYKTLQGHGQSATCGHFLQDGLRACTAYADGVVKLWDLRSGNCLHSVTGQGSHTDGVVAMDCHHDNTLVMTGSHDATAKIINTQTGNVLTSFQCKQGSKQEDSTENNDSVETVGFAKTQTLAATGTLSGCLCIWDVPTGVCRHVCQHEAGIVKLKWDAVSPTVYTAALDGVLRLWDARNGKAVSKWSGHHREILDFDISRDGKTLVSTSEDHTARVFSLHDPDR